MKAFEIQSNANELIIRLDKKLIHSNILLKIAKRLQIECLAQQAGFEGNLLNIAEEIDLNWWENNKESFLKDVKR